MKSNRIPDKWFYFPVIVLFLYFIFRLINQAQMVNVFPLEITNDYGAHLAQLYFLAKYGFHSLVPNWYNGYVLFLFYPPGWYFFALPLYLITQNLMLATFISILIMFICSFLAIYFFGKRSQNFSITKICAFFLFFFANPISIGNYIRLGRVSELFALTNLIILSALILHYKDRKLDKKFFLLFVPFYTLIIIAHPSTAIIFHLLLLAMFIVKKPWKERISLLAASFSGVALSAFWWFPFITNLSSELNRADFSVAKRILDFTGPWAWKSWATFIIIAGFLVTFYFYWLSKNQSKKELLFFSPILIVSILFVTRIAAYLPILKGIYPDVYMLFFLFFSIYFLLKIKFSVLSPFFKRCFLIMLIVGPLISVTISAIHTPYFQGHTAIEEETLNILEYVEGRFYILSNPSDTSHAPMYYAYGAVYLDLSSAGGANNFATTTYDYVNILEGMHSAAQNKDCGLLIKYMQTVNTTDLIGFDQDCDTLESCNLEKVVRKERACLYRLKK